MVSLSNNLIEVYNAPYRIDKNAEEPEESTKLYSLDLQGHRSDIRTLSLSSENDILASTSHSKL